MKISLLIPIVVVLDLGSKALARAALSPGEAVRITPFFDLNLGFNRGIAFGLLNNWSTPLLALVAAAAIGAFAYFFLRETRLAPRIALALILGGAIANLADRLLRGGVTDFLDFHALGFHWPAFNLADSALTLGVLAFLADGMRSRERRSAKF